MNLCYGGTPWTVAGFVGADVDHTSDRTAIVGRLVQTLRSVPSEKRVETHLGKLTGRCGTQGRALRRRNLTQEQQLGLRLLNGVRLYCVYCNLWGRSCHDSGAWAQRFAPRSRLRTCELQAGRTQETTDRKPSTYSMYMCVVGTQ